MKKIKRLTLCALFALCSIYASAYDFSAKNDDGVTIYYNIVSSSKRTCEVSHHTSLIFYSGSVTIPETVTYSGKTYTVIGIGHWAFGYSEELTDVKIPSTITYIDELGFYDCSSLPSVDIPESVTRIGDCAFEDCTSLTSVNIPNGVTKIESQTFENCKSLVSIDIPDSVTSIGNWAFDGCTGLTSVNINNCVAEIDGLVFYTCTNLEKFEVAESNQAYSTSDGVLFSKDMTTLVAFPHGSPLLPSYDIPNSVTTIGSYAFYGCTGLTSITLGKSLTLIDYMVFEDCSDLESMYSLNPEPPECASRVFTGVDKEACTLYVPIGSYDAYAIAYQWKDFHIVEMDMTGIEGVTSDDAEVAGYYTIDGKAVDAPQRGINIVKYSDGSTKKVMMK